MIISIVVCWLLLGLVSSLIYFKRDYSTVDTSDVLICMGLSLTGPAIPIAALIAKIVNAL